MDRRGRQQTWALLLLLPIFALVGCASAGSSCWQDLAPAPKETVDGSERVRRAYHLLEQTDTFASAYIGAGGAPSCQVEAFQVVLGSRNAAEAFAALVDHGHLEGQLYGLAGLYLTDRETFDRLLPHYASLEDPVEVLMGCVGYVQPVSAIVISPIALDPDALARWHEENPRAEYPPVDIASGGWSREFRDAFRR
jgi:hypothetical protein